MAVGALQRPLCNSSTQPCCLGRHKGGGTGSTGTRYHATSASHAAPEEH